MFFRQEKLQILRRSISRFVKETSEILLLKEIFGDRRKRSERRRRKREKEEEERKEKEEKKICAVRESNPDLPRGRRQFYH